jgi:PAS domain S-box-containing protein
MQDPSDAQAATAEFRSLAINSAPALISYIDRDLRYRWANATYERWYGQPLAKVIGCKVPEIVGVEFYQSIRHWMERALAGEEVRFEAAYPTPDGEQRFAHVTYIPDRDSRGEVQGFTVLATDISESERLRRQAEDERRRLTEELERSNDELSQFAYIAAHDLQSPLRMIRTYTQLLERQLRPQLTDVCKEFIQIVLTGSERMEKLISSLLDYARAGEGEQQPELVAMDAVVREALSNLEISIKETQAEITCGELPAVEGDATQLMQLVQNTIANSIKYRRSEVPPLIHIGAQRHGNAWMFCIEDNGQGIKPEYLEHVFKPFKRLHGNEIAGTGMGLAVCRKIVERHGGRMWAESETGTGSRFCFSLPADASFVRR